MKVVSVTEDDETLVARLKEGDMKALSVLYVRHKDPLFTYCLRFGIGESESRDIVHDTFIRIHDRAVTLQNGMAFRPWILTIARHLILNKKRNDRLVFGEVPDAASPDEGPLGAVVRQDASHFLWACIDALDPASREILELRITQELSYREIAAMTGMTEEAVRTRLYRARKTITEHLHGKEGNER